MFTVIAISLVSTLLAGRACYARPPCSEPPANRFSECERKPPCRSEPEPCPAAAPAKPCPAQSAPQPAAQPQYQQTSGNAKYEDVQKVCEKLPDLFSNMNPKDMFNPCGKLEELGIPVQYY
ncbi:hypothetical protein BLNAU_4216 [Blattamonas nauphoetae]|uniref:Uncharacterized protein n=1 Tax=Blattamonas nauphoetae TaxID=2049346 RepID=A0ABQ9YAT2_9EUKA|nr:hypothetical protein BLNAU_4216 [Blattamonas nauphoetae]